MNMVILVIERILVMNKRASDRANEQRGRFGVRNFQRFVFGERKQG